MNNQEIEFISPVALDENLTKFNPEVQEALRELLALTKNQNSEEN